MLNPKTHLAPLPCQQRDVDICSALMGKPLGKTKIEDIVTEPAEPQAANTMPAIDLSNLLVLPKSKEAMKTWVKHVQSSVVQVSGHVKARAHDASDHMKARMAVVSDQMKARMAESAVEAAKRMKKSA
jgi:hypothetical protein